MQADQLTATYSIIAADRRAGLMGAAVQSHYFSVGPVVPWAGAGVGVVATQALVNRDWGPAGIGLLAEGLEPAAVVDRLTGADEGRHGRQFAALTPDGRSAAWTGARCIAAAGHIAKRDVSVQANMMSEEGVPEAMIAAWEGTNDLELAERLLAALEAAEAAGGDIRGRQSAAIVIVTTEAREHVGESRPLELRVEDAAEPLVELRRLLNVHNAYRSADEGDRLMLAGDHAGSAAAFDRAAELAPANIELQFWRAISMAAVGQATQGRRILDGLPAAELPRWLRLAERLPPTRIIAVDSRGWDALLGCPPGVYYHLVLATEFSGAANGTLAGPVTPPSLESEGFVHCSFAHQVSGVWARYFDRDPTVQVLTLDPQRLGAEVRIEDTYDAGETFPHVYGPIPAAAVVSCEKIESFLARRLRRH